MDETSKDATDATQRSLRNRSVGWLAGAGMFVSAGSAWLFCQRSLPSAEPSFFRLLVTGVGFVILPALEGMALSWVLWHFWSKRDVRFGRLMLACGVGWVLVAPIALLLHFDSAWALPMMVLAAVALAPGLHRLVFTGELFPGNPTSGDLASSTERVRGEAVQFGLLPASHSGIWIALAVAAGLECAVIPWVKGGMFAAGLLLAAAVFVLLWQWASTASIEMEKRREDHAAAKLGLAFLLAISITMTVLLARLSGGFGGGGVASGHGARGSDIARVKEPTRTAADQGYKGIILWPVSKKKEIVAPAPMSLSLEAGLNRKPVVIPFDGPYWYFQPPHRWPGRNPHEDRGEPTGVNIRSTGLSPLIMEAHQSLGSPIDLACCRELEMDIRNGDNLPGNIVLAVILTDSHAHGQPSLTLSGQKVLSSEAGHFFIKSSPVEEKLHFPIPAQPKIQKFDEITVVFFPSPDRAIIGIKVAIEQFVLAPR
jgi:hypothetical protein